MPLYRLLLVMIPAGFELRTVTVEFPCGKASQPGTAILFQLFPQWSLPSGISTLSLLVLIDRKGVIHYQTPAEEDENWDKLMTEAAIRQHIEELLGSPSTRATPHTGAARPVASKPTL